MAIYGIIRLEKHKSADLGMVQWHNDREGGGRSGNEDIDPSKTHLNCELVPHGAYEDEVAARIEAGYTGTRKVRKDAVVLAEAILTASPQWFEGRSQGEIMSFFADGLAFFAREFGSRNLVHYTVHLDEATPHAHVGFVPLKGGRLSWKAFIPNKTALSALQDRAHEELFAPRGMERGRPQVAREESRRHLSVSELKRQTEAEVAQARAEREVARKEAARASQERELARVESRIVRREAKSAREDAKRAQEAATAARAQAEQFRQKADAARATLARHERERARVDAEAERLLADYRAEKAGLAEQARAAIAERDAAKAEVMTLRTQLARLRTQLAQVVERAVREVMAQVGRLRSRDQMERAAAEAVRVGIAALDELAERERERPR